ncbi:MAG TPA: methylmalonyl Co-A mutase-associated GTPase MeaB [Polyangiaceae bacterium]
MKRPLDVRQLAERVLAHEPAAVARAISLVEDRRPAAEARIVELLRALGTAPRERCQRVGITGPPGVGKSSLVSALVQCARRAGRSVGVLAVDPSSPRSGGALLGDRARIELDPDDMALFVRSMASGGDLGGLARAAGAAVDVLSAAFELVIVETTGVGQSETDVEHVADTVLLVIQPASGDMLQFLKAGIIEVPDVFVINKADLGAVAERAASELRSALTAVYAGNRPRWTPPIVRTSATSGQGIEELLASLDAHRSSVLEAGELAGRRTRAAAAWALRLFQQRYGEFGVEQAGGRSALLQQFSGWVAAGATAVEVVARAGARAAGP